MTPLPGPRNGPERVLVRRLAAAFESDGYRTYIDPDGTDYFDLVVRRGPEVGLVEGKLSDGRRVLRQALERRVWGDWVGVALASRTAAERLARRTERSRAGPVGIWVVDKDGVTLVRPSRPWPTEGVPPESFAPLRTRFRRLLEALDRGELPAGIPWSDVQHEVRAASSGRGFADWRLDEPGPG